MASVIDEPRPMLIGGDWRQGDACAERAIVNPATGEIIARVTDGGKAEVHEAVRSAREAFDDGRWMALGRDARARILWTVSELIERHLEELALLETSNMGVPLTFARFMIGSCAEAFRYYAGWCTKVHGESTDIARPGTSAFHFTRREPVGVAGLITPWNAPLMMASWKLAPALAAGCTCVVKPSEDTPLTTLRLAALMLEAGVPAGVVNVVTGDGTAGDALAHHPDVNKISFTGSTGVGRRIIQAASGNFKRVTLELGGKSPFIIFDDADLAGAVPAAAQAIFGNSGQVCVAGSRLFVHRSVHDQVVAGMKIAAQSMVVGDPLDPATMMGPLVSEKHFARVSDYIRSGREEGAVFEAGGERIGERGFFMAPTVLSGVRPDMRVVREEIFGPVVCAIPFDDEDEVLARANDTTYGLSSYLWTRDTSRVMRIAAKLQAGSVNVNNGGLFDYSAPLGGYKSSGWGREHGEDGVASFLETKSVFISY